MKQETLEEVAERYSANELSQLGFINGAKWQQEQDNKELAMWKLAVEKQEARCTSLRGVISDLQDKNKFSEEEVILYSDYVLMCSAEKTLKIPLQPKEWFEQFKKK
jgi:hypothetical protein